MGERRGLEGIWASATGNRETYASKTLCGQFWSYKEDEDESVARQRRRFFLLDGTVVYTVTEPIAGVVTNSRGWKLFGTGIYNPSP